MFRFTHFFRKIFWTGEQTPQTFPLFGCMRIRSQNPTGFPCRAVWILLAARSHLQSMQWWTGFCLFRGCNVCQEWNPAPKQDGFQFSPLAQILASPDCKSWFALVEISPPTNHFSSLSFTRKSALLGRYKILWCQQLSQKLGTLDTVSPFNSVTYEKKVTPSDRPCRWS